MTNSTPELIEKAKAAKSVEELLAIAKENDLELTEEDAELYLKTRETGELSDDELSNVAGGAAYFVDYLIVTAFHSCRRWQCKECGLNECYHVINKSCPNCKWEKYKFPFQICTHPETREK